MTRVESLNARSSALITEHGDADDLADLARSQAVLAEHRVRMRLSRPRKNVGA